ncbi:MAG: endonuclease V [Candidatus Woesearchaeota archaeon]
MENLEVERLKEEQTKLAKKIILTDSFDKLDTVAGCDIAYTGNKIISAIVVCDYKTLQIREKKYTIGKTRFPYIPGFLSYRESPITIETFHKLEIDPDILIVDGNGILHPRMLGMASHLGLLLDKPTIGVSKGLLCGEKRGDSIYLGKEVIGKVIETKEGAKPIFVSPGHKIGFSTMLEIIKHCLKEHKLPEPLHEAHKLATKIRNKIKQEKNPE